jgi:hypothetical protein
MSQGTIQVEWFNVTYRSVILLIVLGLALVGGGGGYWYYTSYLAPRTEAQSAIVRADSRLVEAATLLDEGVVEELVDSARGALRTARDQFDERDYQGAAFTAIRSENFSLRALSLVKGKQDQSHGVQIQDVEGDVRVKQSGEFSWKHAKRGMVLQIGDQVKTSSRGKAKLLYFDGTETSIESGSLLEIRDVFEDPVTKVRRVKEKLTWGEVQASTRKRNVSGSYHEVSTEKVAARSEDAGEFRVAYDVDRKTSTVDVFDGRIEVETASRKETVAAGERIRAQADGTLSAKQDLPGTPRLLTPSDQRVFVFEDPVNQSMTLTWEAIPGAAHYQLMIADQPLFSEPLYDAKRNEHKATIEGIPPGSYHWRVAAISRSGIRGPFSEARGFRVSSQRIRDRTDNDPPKLQITEFVAVGQMIVINGETEPGASLWVDDNKIDVYGDGSFNAVVRLRREGLNEVLLVAQDNAGNETKMTRTAFVEVY